MKGITTDALFWRLFSDLSPHLRASCPEISPEAFACNALLQNFTKKLVSSRSRATAQAALDKFLAVNERCKTWELRLETLEDEVLWGEFCNSVHKFFTVSTTVSDGDRDIPALQMPMLDCLSDILRHGNLGPGTSQEAETNDFYTKMFDSPLSTTSYGLYRGYANYISMHPRWQEAENIRQELRGGPKVVEGGRLTFVPKSDTIDRVICIEPVLNSFYQQGVRYLLERRLKKIYQIDLSSQQEKNRELARIGSKNWRDSNSFVTIDLSSASDSMSLKMLERCLPAVTLGTLRLISSRHVTLPSGSLVEMGMISTMGNAFTFPLETILFSCAVDAVFRVDDSERVNPREGILGNWGVFGDDIIIPRRMARKMLRLLDILGFQVNSDKTFVEGPFRESCGADFYEGVDVRPVFVQKLDTIQDFFSVANRLNQWSFRKGVPLRNTVSFLLRRLPRYEVPPWENVDSGLHTPSRFLSSRPRTKQGSFAYRRFVPKPSKLTVDVENEVLYVPRLGPRRRVNPAGLYLSFLRGEIEDGVIHLRPKVVRYSTKVGIAPNWDLSPTTPSAFKHLVGGPGLESLVHCTFFV